MEKIRNSCFRRAIFGVFPKNYFTDLPIPASLEDLIQTSIRIHARITKEAEIRKFLAEPERLTAILTFKKLKFPLEKNLGFCVLFLFLLVYIAYRNPTVTVMQIDVFKSAPKSL
jgi:hypothetical protein